MQLIRTGAAGTMESGDIYVEIDKSEQDGIQIELDSAVERQFGAQIRRVIEQSLSDCQLSSVRVRAVDRGALDCTIRARVATAAHRCAGDDHYEWR